MKAIYFTEVNVEIAKDQPQFNTLPAYISKDGVMVTCFELDEQEIKNIIKNKRIWVQVLKGANPLQPLSLIPRENYFNSVIRDDKGGYYLADENIVNDEIKNLLKDKDDEQE